MGKKDSQGYISIAIFALLVLILLVNILAVASTILPLPKTSDLQPSQHITDKEWSILYDLNNDKLNLRMGCIGSALAICGVKGTGSMRPTISNHTLLLIKENFSHSEIKVGDIVIFENDGKRICHRVVSIETDFGGTYYITKGDNNEHVDDIIHFENIKGIVVGLLY